MFFLTMLYCFVCGYSGRPVSSEILGMTNQKGSKVNKNIYDFACKFNLQ